MNKKRKQIKAAICTAYRLYKQAVDLSMLLEMLGNEKEAAAAKICELWVQKIVQSLEYESGISLERALYDEAVPPTINVHGIIMANPHRMKPGGIK
ncbi:MAG: hypothetical protein ACE5I1_29275 [bacterium]